MSGAAEIMKKKALRLIDTGVECDSLLLNGDKVRDAQIDLVFEFLPEIDLSGGALYLLDRWSMFVLRLAISPNNERWSYALPDFNSDRPLEGFRDGNSIVLTAAWYSEDRHVFDLQALLGESWGHLTHYADLAAIRMGRPICLMGHCAAPITSSTRLY